jgi:8-oxo-dGTP pyrophosphatase MutT (NUDIX family)
MSKINHITPEELSQIRKPAAAGLLVLNDAGEFLLTQRSDKAHFLPGYWTVPSGESDVNKLESLENCARREFFEETTHRIPEKAKLVCIDRYFADERMYFLFLYRCKGRFFVKIDFEHKDVNWFKRDNLPSPMSPQILDAIERIPYL